MKGLAFFAGALAFAESKSLLRRVPDIILFPENNAKDVNPDTHLVLEFPSPPTIGSLGKIQVYDTTQKLLIDTLDLSIPSSPSPYGNGSTKANYSDTTTYQTNIIGGMDFYFHPIIIRENVATIYLHNNRLEYNTTYSVTIDPTVLQLNNSSLVGITSNSSWTFTTKPHGPKPGTKEVLVSANGSGDFNTVQGAIDWAPINPVDKTIIFIKNGNYEELVFFQYKSNLVIRGENRNKTTVGYPNNSAFNPPNRQGSSRRPAFSFRGVTDVQLSDFSITNYYRGQAEALLIDGMRIIVDHMYLNGSGDALTTYGTVYIADTTLWGDGDTILGYGSVFWERSTIVTTAGPVSWTRTAQGVHGNVLLNCTIVALQGNSTFARLPDNKGGVQPNWPYAEMVLINTRTEGIAPVGWGPVQGEPFDTRHLHLWEFNTTNLKGEEVDYSERLNVSRRLRWPQDELVVNEYSKPEFVLGGWVPAITTSA